MRTYRQPTVVSCARSPRARALPFEPTKRGVAPFGKPHKGTYPLTQLKELLNMASYHCAVKVLSRSSGRSSVQFSAYMSGEKQYDERLGQTFSHTSKEEVCYNTMIFADRVPEQMREQEKFWNSVEAAEKANNSQVSRTWEIALPHELTMEQNKAWIEDFARSLVEKDGMPAIQLAIHEKEGNWHAHIMAPTRDMDEKGKWLAKEQKVYKLDEHGERIPKIDPKTGEQKVDSHNRKQWERETVERNNWNSKDLLQEWRERTAHYQNRGLEMAHSEVRVDHRSLKEQGIDREPTIHEGYVARQMADRGLVSERVEYNKAVAEINAVRAEIERQKGMLEQIQTKWQEYTKAWEVKLDHVREQISERIRGIGDRITGRTAEQTVGFNRDGVKPTASERIRNIRAELDNTRAEVRDRGAEVEKQDTLRQARDAEQERLRAEEIERELARSREDEWTISR